MVPGRYQTGLTYDPSMRAGTYRGGAVPRNSLADAYADVPRTSSFAPVQSRGGAMMAPPAPAAPTLAGGTGALSGAPPAYGMDGAGESAQGEYGGPGPTGAPGTGNFGEDAKNAAQALGPAAASMAFGGPMGIAGVALGGIAAGMARGFGYNSLSDQIAAATFGPAAVSRAESPYGGISQEAVDASYGQTPASAAAEAQDAETAAQNGVDGAGTSASAADNNNTNSAAEGQSGLGNDGTGAGGAGMGAGAPGNDPGGDPGADSPAFREGGYTGDDGDEELEPISATLHEGEFVVRPEAVRMYGRNFLHAINEGQMPVNALAGAMGGGRQMQSANNLLQMMRR